MVHGEARMHDSGDQQRLDLPNRPNQVDLTIKAPGYSGNVRGLEKHERSRNLDFLRVLAAYAVVWLHVSALVVATDPSVTNITWWIGNIYDSFSRWCVPVFVMLSGALLIPKAANTSAASFVKTRITRIIAPLVFWTLAYIIFKYLTGANLTTLSVIKSILAGDPYAHLWFLYMITGLYLITPILQQIIDKTPHENVITIVILVFFISSAESLAGGKGKLIFSMFMPYIGYYMSGYLLFKSETKHISFSLNVTIVVVCGAIIAVFTGILLPYIGEQAWAVMYGYLNPLVILMSFAVFIGFLGVRPPSIFSSLAPMTLGIYLVHPMWLYVLQRIGISGFFLNPFLGTPITATIAFGLSAVSAMVLAQIPVFRRTVC